MVNAKNTTELNPIVWQVIQILGLKNEEFIASDAWYKAQIDHILKTQPEAIYNKELALYLIREVDVEYFYKLPPALKEDKAVALAALSKDSSVFMRLKPAFRLQLDFAKEGIKSLVREKVSFIEVEKYMRENFPEWEMFQKVFSFYKKYLAVAEHVFHSDIERQLIHIRETAEGVYKKIFEKPLLERQWKKILISKTFTQIFLKEISEKEGYAELEAKQKEVYQLEIIETYLWITSTEKSESVMVFLQTLRDMIHIQDEKKKTEAEDTEKWEEDTSDSDIESSESEAEDRFDYCVPSCIHIFSDNGGCDLPLGQWVYAHLSKEELKNMNNMALKNYVSWVQTLHSLWLWFALAHQERFFSICDIDYIHGEGLSDAKILKILNKVGNKVGIPEKKLMTQEEDEEEKTEVWCFHTIDEGMYRFKEIRNSGIINGELVEDPAKKWDKSIVQIDLIRKGLFSNEWKWFTNIESWS